MPLVAAFASSGQRLLLRLLDTMANPEHESILRGGGEAWNTWRLNNPSIRPDISGASLIYREDLIGVDLQNATVRDVRFDKTNLSHAKLGPAVLSGVSFNGSNLTGASLKGSALDGADFTGADLTSTDLRETDVRNATFQKTVLDDAKFEGAFIGATIFANVDLSDSIGLENVVHLGPSTVGVDTIYRSRGNLPEAFLRGVGLPDPFILYLKSLMGGVLDFYSCFISYSTKDQEFADRLYADLQSKGVRCWFSPEDIAGGKKLHEQIDEAIRVYDRLLLILSEDSMKSEWVKTEIAHARQRELKEDQRQVLFPISLVPFTTIRAWKNFDSDTGKDSAREIREYFIPDFSNWEDHNSYQKAFGRLLKDLKAT